MWNRLKRLHHLNGYATLFLFISGILLFIPSLRGPLAPYRVMLKDAHIWIGFATVAFLLLYFRYFAFHYKVIKKQQGKKRNLAMVIGLIIGWIISGTVLTFQRSLPEGLVQASLIAHDVFTWIGLPVLLFHSVTRSGWFRKRSDQLQEKKKELYAFSRRGFFKYGIVTLLAIILGPSIFKWLKQVTDDGGSTLQEVALNSTNELSPLPIPATQSSPPIGGGYEGKFRVYTVTETPVFTNENWNFTIDGLVDEPVSLSWEEFVKLKRTVQVSDFHCVTGWSVLHVTYEGILLKDLMKKVKLKENASHLKFYSGDGVYTDSLSLEQAALDDVMVAVLMDGELIPSDYGGPVRLIVPKMYAYKSVKWLVRIEAIDHVHEGYWQVRGYDTDAWVGSSETT